MEILYTTLYNETKAINIVNLPNSYNNFFIVFINSNDYTIGVDYAANEQEFKDLVAYHTKHTETFSLYQIEQETK
jgi:hypothetical protein